MRFFYLPKTRERSFLFSKKKRFHRIYNRRHNRPKEVLRLVKMIVGLFLLWFAVQVGIIIPLSLQDPSALGAMDYVQNRDITLPYSENTNHEYTQSRLYIYIVIDKRGKAEVEGKLLPDTERIKFLGNFLDMQPLGIPIFIVDKETPMEFVTNMIHYVREAGFRRIKFSTSQEPPNNK